MTDKNKLPEMLFRPSRRQIISGMAALGAVATGSVRQAFA
jgi:TolB protein